MEEWDAPTQLLIGAKDHEYCVMTAMGACLEINFDLQPNDNNDFHFSFQGYNSHQTIKNLYSNAMRLIVESTIFIAKNGNHCLGTHSSHKYVMIEACSSARSNDAVDHHGLWKSDKCQQDTYASVTIPYVNAKVAAKLCEGVPITYQHIDGSGITNKWILQHIAQNMRNYLEQGLCIVFGHALLCECFRKSNIGIVETVMATHGELSSRNTLGKNENPNVKLPLGFMGVNTQLLMDVILQEPNEDGNAPRHNVRV